MGQSDFDERRQDLLESIERDEEEVRVAVHQLTTVAGAKLDIAEYIKRFPLSWSIGAFLVGAWLGTRGAPNDRVRQRS